MSERLPWWRRYFGFRPSGYVNAIELLRARYIEERQHEKRFTDQAGKMQYPQFRDKLLTIAAEESIHADCIAEKIALLGGKLPEVPQKAVEEKSSWRYLLDDLEEERRCSDELVEEIRTIAPKLPRSAELLQHIHEDEERHRIELREMLMRSDPQTLWPA